MSFLLRGILVTLLFLPTRITLAGPNAGYHLVFSDSNTSAVVKILENGISECQALAAVYRFDCYRQSYRSAALDLKGRSDYRAAQRALQQVEQTLRTIVRKNRDKSAPTIRSSGRTYKAVTPAAVNPSNDVFARARADAATSLLRTDGKGAVHFQRIAAVIGSNKVIIRS